MPLRTACLLIALLLSPPIAWTPAFAAAQPSLVGATSAPSEAAASQQLDRRLRSIDALHGVTATISGDIARLDGKVIGAGDRKLAEQIAGQLPGVARVDNRIQLSS